MKKNILYTFMVTVALLLSGCGSNSKSDKNLKDLEGVNLFETEAGSLNINNLNFKTSIPFTKLEGSDVGVELSNFNLTIAGCELDGPVTYSPNPLILNGSKGTQTSITMSGKVKNTCTATG
ncbi:MAG TPA: hypothetical protein ENK68_00405, partial [Epsilonproteobacteria bacterium]|nr:hypothetical protein [Campylobacterota bacterium]